MAINSFDNDSVKRISRAVRLSEHSPLQSPTYRRKNRSRAIGDTLKPNPFQISVSNGEILVLGGILNVKGSAGDSIGNHAIEGLEAENGIDISEIEENKTIYIYAKISTDWADGSTIKSTPTISITGDEIKNNDVLFPTTDLGHAYYSIGSVDIEWDAEEEKRTTEINQVLFTNIELTGFNLHPFKVVVFFDEKTEDIDDNVGVSWFSLGGMVTHPEGSSNLADQKGITGLDEVFYYIKLTYTKNTDLYLENYSPQLICAVNALEIELETQTIIKTARTTARSIIQSVTEDWRTDGKVW